MSEIRINGKKLGLVNGKKVRAIHYGLKTFYPTYEEEVKPTIITFDLTDSSKLQPEIALSDLAGTYTVDWGDGNVQTVTQTNVSSKYIKKATPYASTGVYNVKVLVEDPTLYSGTIKDGRGSSISIDSAYRPFITAFEYQEEIYQTTSIQQFYMSKMTSFNIPKGIKSIVYGTFMYCYKLKDVEIPEGVEEIGNQVFGGNSSSEYWSNTTIVLPSTLKQIGYYVFVAYRHCNTLVIKSKTVLACTSSSNSICTNTSGGKNWTTAIKVPAELLDAYKADSYWSQYSNITAIEE